MLERLQKPAACFSDRAKAAAGPPGLKNPSPSQQQGCKTKPIRTFAKFQLTVVALSPFLPYTSTRAQSTAAATTPAVQSRAGPAASGPWDLRPGCGLGGAFLTMRGITAITTQPHVCAAGGSDAHRYDWPGLRHQAHPRALPPCLQPPVCWEHSSHSPGTHSLPKKLGWPSRSLCI